MKPLTRKSKLSAGQFQLIELMQQINFGRIEGLWIRNGEPQFAPPPKIICEIKFGGENGPRPQKSSDDFELKAQVVELLQHLERIGNAIIDTIEVKHGLPFRLIVEQG